MKAIVVGVIDKAFNANRDSMIFLRRLIICLVIVGVIFGILACYVSGFFAIVEGLIAPALIWAIRSYTSINKDNVGILVGANESLSGARKQVDIERRINKEIRKEKRGGK